MAAKIDYDTDKRIIYVTDAPIAGVLTLNVVADIYSDSKEDWKISSALNKFKFPFSEPVGGNTIIPATKYISPYYFLKYGWKMRPYEEDHTLYLTDAYLLIDGGGDPWMTTLGGYTVNIRDSIPADSFILGGDYPSVNEITTGVRTELTTEMILILEIARYTGNKITRSGDVITIYEEDGYTIWKKYNVANRGRVPI